MSHRILVAGASGTIGSALVAELLRQGADVTALRSKPSSEASPVPVVVGDFARPDTLAEAMRGFDTLFLLLPLAPDMLAWAANALQAARDAGIRHVVRSSGAGADPDSPMAIARVQGEIDRLVMQSGLPWTILRPTFFMQNHVNFNAGAIRAGTLYAAHGEGAMAVVDVRDIAAAAAVVLADPAPHEGRTYDLTGPEALTEAEQMALISQELGRPVQYVDVPLDTARDAMAASGMPPAVVDWLTSLNAIVRNGWGAGLADGVQTLTGRPPLRFADFVRGHAHVWR
jgi:uncharacterized protein YbjT (DUF2867 family)